MTREEAKQMFRKDKNGYGCYKAVLTKIDKVYDDFEKNYTPNLGSEDIIKMANEHKQNIGKDKATYLEGVIFGYMMYYSELKAKELLKGGDSE